MAGGLRRKPCPPGNRADYVSFDLNRDRRRSCGSELRIECAGNPFRAPRRKCRRRIEQAEVARMRDVDETMLHLLDGPRQQFVKRARHLEIEVGEFAPEPRYVDPGSHWTSSHPAIDVHQLAREEIVD